MWLLQKLPWSITYAADMRPNVPSVIHKYACINRLQRTRVCVPIKNITEEISRILATRMFWLKIVAFKSCGARQNQMLLLRDAKMTEFYDALHSMHKFEKRNLSIRVVDMGITCWGWHAWDYAFLCLFLSLLIARCTSTIKIDHGENREFNIVVEPVRFENKSSYFNLILHKKIY